jgi:acetyltransferase-like isoleucine patch superfamily enzyme
MKHRILHSMNLRQQLPHYAEKLQVTLQELTTTYEWMLTQDMIFEEGNDDAQVRVSIVSVNIEKRITHPLAQKFYACLRDEIPTTLVPMYALDWITFKDRCLRAWEQCYNILINKIPSHNLRLWWLRRGGAKIGKGSTIWRNTEVLGMENLRIGEDSVIAWHCQVDARAGLIIGDHVTVASYVLIIAGTHDMMAPEFWSVSAPIYIEDYAWIASRAMITHGAHLRKGAVITAGCIVSKEIAAYKIVGGMGAKPMGERPHDLTYKVGGKNLLTLFY